MSREQDVCKGAVALGTGCKRCSKCAIELAEIVTHLQATKPEQAQTAVGLPEPDLRLGGGNYSPLESCTEELYYLGETMESYATAKTAEAVRELVDGMRYMRQEFAGLPHSLGYDFTHLPKIDAILAKHEPKKDQ